MKKAFIVAVTALVGASLSTAGAARADESGFYREQPLTARQIAADQEYVSNGSFDWRHRRHHQPVPWYAYSQSGNCYVWTPNAYHYACDPNSRY